MRALVTGAGGFIGANLVRHLLERGHEPVAMVRPGGNRWRLEDLNGQARTEFVDLRWPEAVSRCVLAVAPDVIFHLAAHGAYSWQTDFDTMLGVNVRSTEVLLEAARRADARLVHAGSSSEYGLSNQATAERDRVAPNSHYAVTKVAATHLCSLAAARYQQHAVTLRLYSVYGPWEEPGRLMPTLVDRALDGSYPPLVAPETARDFVWIGDVCDAFVRAAAAHGVDPGAVLNVASGTQTTLRDVVGRVRSLFEVRGDPVWGTMPGRSWDTSVWVGDPGKAAEVLGWTAVTGLESGLRALGSWLAADPVRRERYADPAPTPTPTPAPAPGPAPRSAGNLAA